MLTQVLIGDHSFARGLIPELGYPDTIDPLAWYEATPWAQDLDDLDLLGVARTYDDVRALLVAAWADPDETVGAGTARLDVSLDADQADALRDTDSLFALAPYGTDIDIVVEAEATGHVSAVEMSGESDEWSAAMRIEIHRCGRGTRAAGGGRADQPAERAVRPR